MGLQRDQFIPFIKILESYCYQKELLINEDYRVSKNKKIDRFLTPINESTNFILNKFFRQITKDKQKNLKTIEVKGRNLKIENFYDGVAKFHFDELCDRNLGAEDYVSVAN
jgi:predicted ATPase